jgi:glycosyltransferase involved in cell wall biosynthesis
MKIALVGTRGVPANYGGFETCAEEIGVGLAERGHDVIAYCRPGNAEGNPAAYAGVKLVYRPFIDKKSLGTLSHTFASMAHAVRQDFDVIMLFNAGNSPSCILPKLFRVPVAVNVDGLEWKRAKWGRIASRYYQIAEWISCRLADRIVSDSRGIQAYYEERYREQSSFIAYGGRIETSEKPEILVEYGLEPNEYFFVASRLEPENHADLTVEAYSRVTTDKKLVIAGGANWASPYVERIKATKDPRVVFLGPVYKPGHIKELHCNAYAYVHGNEVGGTNPALLKALGYGNCVLALDVSFNAEVLADGKAGVLYDMDIEDLAVKLQRLVDNPHEVETFRARGPARILEAYQWDAVTADYEQLLERVASGYYKSKRPSD